MLVLYILKMFKFRLEPLNLCKQWRMLKVREAGCIITLFVTHDDKHNIWIHTESTIQ
jgi:hypothetical protein